MCKETLLCNTIPVKVTTLFASYRQPRVLGIKEYVFWSAKAMCDISLVRALVRRDTYS
jgi:hypothetical protein